MAGLLDAVQKAFSGGEQAITGLASGVKAMLSARQGNNNQASNVIYGNFGMVGAAGRQRLGRGKIPSSAPTTSRYKPKTDNTEKLLTDVVRYLVSINNTLKKQIDFDKRVYEENALAAREAKIENTFGDLAKRYGGAANDNNKQNDSGIISKILTTLGSLGKLGLKTLLGGLTKAIGAFKTAWQWLRGLSFLKNVKNILGLARLLAAGPALATLAVEILLFLGLDWYIKDANKGPLKALNDLEKKYGMKRVPGGYLLPDGKIYKPEELPSRYKDIEDAYGPNNRGGTSDEARKRIAANPEAYTPEALKRSLTGGDQVGAPPPSATKPMGDSEKSAAGNSPYDVVLGFGKYGKPEDYYDGRKLTELTVAEAMEFGKKYLQPRSKADGLGRLPDGKLVGDSGMGAYQTNRTTMQGAIDAGIITPSELYDQDAQDRVAKWLYDLNNKQGNLNNTWAYFGNRGQKSSPMTFEQAKPLIMEGEGTSKRSNNVPASQAANAQSDASSDGIIEKAKEAANDALMNIAEFIGTIGGKIVGPGIARSLTSIGPDFAKLISEESNRIQNEIAMGEKKQREAASNLSPAAQSLRIASPNGSISVINPNYLEGGNSGIEKYLAHYKLAP